MRKYYISTALILAAFSAFAADPTYITNNSTCSATSLSGLTSGNVSLRTVYQPKSVPITWESNGTTVATTSCTYDTQLQLPSAPSRLGYTFRGWELRAQCLIPSTDVNNNAEWDSPGCLDINGAGVCAGKTGWAQNAPNYGITQPGEWGVSWSNGDKVTGVALCSAHSGDHHDYQWDGNSSDWTSDETTLISASGETQYCWCKATHYTANNAQQCSLSSPVWVYINDSSLADNCAYNCPFGCASIILNYSSSRVALFAGNVAQ